MGYLTDGLTFNTLRGGNVARLGDFKNAKGERCHVPDGSDWALSAWCNATCGELGELANLVKKIERGDFTLDDARAQVADELADVTTYLDLLAYRCGVNLGQAITEKFNKVSARVGSRVYIGCDDWHYRESPLVEPERPPAAPDPTCVEP